MRSLDPTSEWQEALAAWAIPPRILETAPEPPWQLPRHMFSRRADAHLTGPIGISQRRAAEALSPGGSLLDVGAGAGAASLPLASRVSRLIAVDERADMLEELAPRAAGLGVNAELVAGRWPEVADQVPACDVAICAHVVYNVPDIGPFLMELSAHATRRVVIEMTARHPVSGLNPLWRKFHGIDRPDRPTWRDVEAILRQLGIEPHVERWRRPAPDHAPLPLDELVALTRRRLCLPAARDPEVLQAMTELGVDPERDETWSLSDSEVVTMFWDTGPPRSSTGR